jgi:6-phosphogluconolactonase (cycloisomerase 2 family)
MHRLKRLARFAGLAAAIATIATSLTAGGALAAGLPAVGHVYVNGNTAGRNTIAGFDRHSDGSLSPISGSPFDTGGAGTGAAFGSAGGLQETADGRYILATNPASNDVSVLRIKHDGTLELVEVQDANGITPTSIAVHGSLVYVANTGRGGSNYTGFRLNGGGHLRAIAGSTYPLPDDALPGQVLISPDGNRLVATRVGPNAGPSYLDAFQIGRDGRLTAAPGSPFPAQRIGPFGSAFSPTHRDQLFVSNAHDGPGAGSVSVYNVGADGTLAAIVGSPFANNQTAPCWVAISPDGRALFAVNTASGSISSYTIANDGTLGLVGSTGLAGAAPRRAFDAAVSPDGTFLYIVNAVGGISGFSVDGTTITELTGSPVPTPPGGAPFGIVVD